MAEEIYPLVVRLDTGARQDVTCEYLFPASGMFWMSSKQNVMLFLNRNLRKLWYLNALILLIFVLKPVEASEITALGVFGEQSMEEDREVYKSRMLDFYGFGKTKLGLSRPSLSMAMQGEDIDFEFFLEDLASMEETSQGDIALIVFDLKAQAIDRRFNPILRGRTVDLQSMFERYLNRKKLQPIVVFVTDFPIEVNNKECMFEGNLLSLPRDFIFEDDIISPLDILSLAFESGWFSKETKVELKKPGPSRDVFAVFSKVCGNENGIINGVKSIGRDTDNLKALLGLLPSEKLDKTDSFPAMRQRTISENSLQGVPEPDDVAKVRQGGLDPVGATQQKKQEGSSSVTDQIEAIDSTLVDPVTSPNFSDEPRVAERSAPPPEFRKSVDDEDLVQSEMVVSPKPTLAPAEDLNETDSLASTRPNPKVNAERAQSLSIASADNKPEPAKSSNIDLSGSKENRLEEVGRFLLNEENIALKRELKCQKPSSFPVAPNLRKVKPRALKNYVSAVNRVVKNENKRLDCLGESNRAFKKALAASEFNKEIKEYRGDVLARIEKSFLETQKHRKSLRADLRKTLSDLRKAGWEIGGD